MKPQQYVIALSRPGRTGDSVRALDVAGEFPFPARAPHVRHPTTTAHKFDCSEEELGTMLEWLLRLSRTGV